MYPTWEVESVTALAERMTPSTTSLTILRVQRILTLVVLLTHLWKQKSRIKSSKSVNHLYEPTFVSQDLLSSRDVHELFLSLLLVLLLLELVGMPLHRQLLVCLQIKLELVA